MLSERQINLLNTIINEYIENAEPVGSVEVVKKHSLKCSPATVRNEMAKLIELGYLQMPHSSAGRVPTRQAYRLYLDQIMHEDDIPVLQEVAMKQRLWPSRYIFEKLLHEAAAALADSTKTLAITTTNDGYITYSGAVNVLENREFWEIDVAKAALLLVDNPLLLEKIFQRIPYQQDVNCVIEDELELDNMHQCALVFSTYATGNKSGHIAVLGPSRMKYGSIIPTIRYVKNLIEELGNSW